MRTLEAALREHLQCIHHPFHDVSGPWDEPAHVMALAGLSSTGGLAAAGSYLFHCIAALAVAMDGHTRTPVHITDEEYASFVADADA